MTGHPFELTGPDPDAVTKALAEHGIALLPRYLDDAGELSAAEHEAREALHAHPDHAQALSSYPDGNGIRVERARAAADHPALASVFERPWMRRVAELFFGGEPYVFNHDLMIVMDVVGTEHLAHRVHYDRMPQLKFFLYLTDTTADNGAFHCLPGSHRHAKELQRDNRRRLVLPASAETRLETPEFTTGQIPVEGPAGTLLVIDSDLAHRGSPIRRGHRLTTRSRSYHPAYLSRWATGPT
ncbi:phytanoyl-CoA dioxygenase family protein [Actinomadura kijaniata]|uniref:phytanoyl-CoA dioxygenase family protein n=1 Tax=Actinomadura kijaniata TaxID=46161 RepID=UPI0008313118|nr:phytanoyl-CoA dioxygenase family protein [Actinomadura kijaniata]